jgi:hypothetical protein
VRARKLRAIGIVAIGISVGTVSLLRATQPPPFHFDDVARDWGSTFILRNSASPEKRLIETMVSGVALFDYNADGWLDIFLVNGAAIPQLEKTSPGYYNRLYRNNQGKGLTDVTASARVEGTGYSMGVAVGDYDNDGYEDLYVAGVNRNQLLHNEGGRAFSDVTGHAGVQGLVPGYGKGWGQSAGWFDYDNDGDLDLLVVNYVRWSLATDLTCKVGDVRTYCAPEHYQGLPNILYRNNGNGTFTDVSVPAGIGDKVGKGMGVAFADYDGDGFTDIFVANDTLRSFLFRNNGDGTFAERGVLAGVAFNENGKSIAGMGADFRDVDNDGRPDVFVTGMVNDTFPLFRNLGRWFEDVTSRTGVARATRRVTGWSAGIFDFDNDGRKDLYAALGAILDNSMEVQNLPAKLPNMLLHNQGARFSNAGTEAGPAFNQARMHRGAAFGDLNNDGRVDIVTSSLNEPAEVLLNGSPNANHWLILVLEGRRSNRTGIGAKVRIEPEGGVAQANHATTSVGLSSSSDRRVHFGLGAATLVKTVEIEWPGGRKQRLENVAADQILRVVEDAP